MQSRPRCSATWNLCTRQPVVSASSSANATDTVCWFAEDQAPGSAQGVRIERVAVPPGEWFVRIRGDVFGRLSGQVALLTQTVGEFNLTKTVASPLATDPPWNTCTARLPLHACCAVAAEL